MMSLSRFVALAVVASAAVLATAAPAYAQAYGVHSHAVDFAPVDAAALGDTLHASAGLYAGDEGLAAAGGFGGWSGALRGYVVAHPGIRQTGYSLGLGYARGLITPTLAGPFRGTFGIEAVGGYLHTPYAPWDAGALRVTAAVGVSLGDPSGTSLGLYGAPYVESAMMGVPFSVPVMCTRNPCGRVTWYDVGLHSAAGVGVGGRASVGRLSLELILRDVAWRGKQLYGEGMSALGLTYRLGR